MSTRTSDHYNELRQQAFDNSLHANLISTPATGKILIANDAACKLLGYSHKVLKTLRKKDLFDNDVTEFNAVSGPHHQTTNGKRSVVALRKNGKRIACEISTSVFLDAKGVERAVTTLVDLTQNILSQKNKDLLRETLVAENIILAKRRQKKIDFKNEKLVSDNIVLAKSRQKHIDKKNEKIVTDNINIAISKQKSIDKLQEKVTAQQLSEAMKDARELERSDIGKELHDNVNQLLGASRMYLELAKKGGANSSDYLNRSSEYTLSAIEAIRQLTRGLVTDIIKTLGLCEAIENIRRDTMEVSDLNICFRPEGFQEKKVIDKFKLNLFRIVQEHLTNILKHAKATKVIIKLIQDKDSVTLFISDNGVGFDTGINTLGIGLENIRSRSENYNGTARFNSTRGKGCILAITFPVKGIVKK